MDFAVEHYMQLLPTDAHDLIKNFLDILKVGGGLQALYTKLINLLVQLPYPTLQILCHYREQSKFHIGKVIAEALEHLLVAATTAQSDEYSPQLINFLNNFPLCILEAASSKHKLINRLTRPAPLSDKVCVALLSRQQVETQLLNEVQLHLQRQWQICNVFPSKEFILYQALELELHFIPLVSVQIKDFSVIKNVPVRNNLLVLKIANELSQCTQTLDALGNVSRWLEWFKLEETAPDLAEVHTFFHADFQRICAILEFLKKYGDIFKTIKVEHLLRTNGILELVYENEIDAGFDDLRRIIESIYKWQQKISGLKCMHDLELETLNYYFALSNVYDVVLADASINFDNFYSSKMQQLNIMLRQLRNIDLLCSLLEDIFYLVFLRWEHLRNDRTRHSDGHRSHSASSSNSTDDEAAAETPASTFLAPSPANSVRHGFICSGRALKQLFTFLKNFLTKKLHSEDLKHASERIQLRFQRIIDIVSEALWKYSVLEKIDDSLTRAGTHQKYLLEPEELLQLVQLHVNSLEKSSSDDESRERSNYTSLTRRKAAKKRRRATFSGPAGGGAATSTLEQSRARANIMVASVSAVQGKTDPIAELKARHMVVRFTDRGIIPKMLGSPENLAIMALALKNFSDVKYIIETFNLQNTELNRELYFVEQQQQIKQKLGTIYANYQQQERNSRSNQGEPKATIEQIKSVAAKGFEVSKIISVIDNFAQTHKLQQTAEQKQLVQKYGTNPQYAFLQQFEERNLNAVIITDLILNLPFNREVTSNILMVIRRQQQITVSTLKEQSSSGGGGAAAAATQKAATAASKVICKEVGAVPFLENLCECLRLVPNKSLRELLYDNYYSLKPHKLSMELQREQTFNAIFYKKPTEIGRCEDLKVYAPLFQNLQSKCNYYARFYAYTTHLSKLLQLRDVNCEYHISELLKIDPCDVIGELVFECNMTPLEIENNVSALNLNLVHVIALNISPEIAGRSKSRTNAQPTISSKKLETIFNYISNQNQLLAYILQGITNSKHLLQDKSLTSTYLQRLIELPEIDNLSQLYDGNKLIAALRSDNLNMKLVDQLSLRDKLNILLLQLGYREPKHIQAKVIDKIIVALIQQDAKNINLATHIHNISLKATLIYENFTKIATTRLAKELIESTLQHREAATKISAKLRSQLEDTLADITVYAKVSEVLQFETWPQAYDFGLKTPNRIFQKLLQSHLYKLCFKWCNVVKLSERFKQHRRLFFATLLEAMLELNDHVQEEGGGEVNSYLLQILNTFPVEDCVGFLDANKEKFRSIWLLKYVIDFLTKNASSNANDYKNYRISIVIFEQLTPGEREHFWTLLRYPLLILEQFIMNAKFEILTKVLSAVRKVLQDKSSNALVESNTSSSSTAETCTFCFDKRGHIYDVHSKSSANNSPRNKMHLRLGSDANTTNSAFILLSFNLYQKDHIITNECIDLLLRIYATKALDYHISDINSSLEQMSQSTDAHQSLDSLCGTFLIPKLAPSREEWVRDDEATHCMCCRRAKFTMLMRRHHCRRCGRVVCFACSTHRLRIPELYADVEVRICSDCQQHIEEGQRKLLKTESRSMAPISELRSLLDMFKWQLSGNITHDKVLREEFCYEHAPSVALCLSILEFHLGQQKCVDLLLYHCRKLETLIVPNPEVDYELVAKMMNCLAVAAKVRGATADVETIREHSEIVISVVQNGCEALIPPGQLNNHSLRKLGDSLVQAEKWQLALDVHLKYGFPTAGVMAAHGLSCLRAGCYDTAREKLSHCMPKLSNELYNSKIYKYIMQAKVTSNSSGSDNNENHTDHPPEGISYIKRPQRGPPLLHELIKIIETTQFNKPQPETLQRASIIRNSNTSLVSLLSRRKETPYIMPLHEPALNVLTTLANLKRIASGQYSEGGNSSGKISERAFEECMHYVLTYGSHADVIQFLMKHQALVAALKYFHLQNLDADLFIHNIFMAALHCGEVPKLIQHILELDAQMLMWHNTLLHTCRYLEKKNLLNSLYHLQILLKDPVRASITCVKFYSMNCENFQQLHANAQHLHNAHMHLQTELENSQWEQINLNAANKRKSSINSRDAQVTTSGVNDTANSSSSSFVMQMDARSLNGHINTILKQLDVAKFLAKCEKEQNSSCTNVLITEKILKQIRIETSKSLLPTLFDSLQDKIQICILLLYCGKNIEEGFGLAYRIIQDYKLPAIKIYGATSKYLARNQRLAEVEKLLNCITSNNGSSTRDIDEILAIAINAATNSHEPEVKTALDTLVKRINKIELRISCHIFIGQLKSAYLLANKYERLGDIRKILRQAELTNQIHIKKLCEKKLLIANTLQAE